MSKALLTLMAVVTHTNALGLQPKPLVDDPSLDQLAALAFTTVSLSTNGIQVDPYYHKENDFPDAKVVTELLGEMKVMSELQVGESSRKLAEELPPERAVNSSHPYLRRLQDEQGREFPDYGIGADGYFSVGDGACRDDANNHPYWKSFSGTEYQDVLAACNADSTCIGFWQQYVTTSDTRGSWQVYCSAPGGLCDRPNSNSCTDITMGNGQIQAYGGRQCSGHCMVKNLPPPVKWFWPHWKLTPDCGRWEMGARNHDMNGHVNQGGHDVYLHRYEPGSRYILGTPKIPVRTDFMTWFATPDEEHGRAIDTDASDNVYGLINVGQSNPNKYIRVVSLDTTNHNRWETNLGMNDGTEDHGSSLCYQNEHVYVLGGTMGNRIGEGRAMTRRGVMDHFVSKIDASNGQVVWSKTIAGSGWDWPWGMITADPSTGGIVFAAQSESTNGDYPNRIGRYDVVVVKMSPEGELTWVKRFGSSDDDFARGLKVDASGNVYVSYETRGSQVNGADVLSGSDYVKNAGVYKISLKLDANGNTLWHKQFGNMQSNGWQWCVGDWMDIDEDGNMFNCGYRFDAESGARTAQEAYPASIWNNPGCYP